MITLKCSQDYVMSKRKLRMEMAFNDNRDSFITNHVLSAVKKKKKLIMYYKS